MLKKLLLTLSAITGIFSVVIANIGVNEASLTISMGIGLAFFSGSTMQLALRMGEKCP